MELPVIDWKKVEKAVGMISEGFTKKVELENVKIYSVGENVIRMDIKEVK